MFLMTHKKMIVLFHERHPILCKKILYNFAFGYLIIRYLILLLRQKHEIVTGNYIFSNVNFSEFVNYSFYLSQSSIHYVGSWLYP